MPVAARTDEEIRQDVLRELQYDSRVDQAEIGVEVNNGIVTLTGTVESDARKRAAREAAYRVIGALDVADAIQVQPPEGLKRTDADIARTVRLTLEWDPFLPHQKIRSMVSEGWVILEGEVSTVRELEDAERVVRVLAGVQGVDNLLTVATTRVDREVLRKSIEDALELEAEREAEKIIVNVEGDTVTLEGRVRTWPEKNSVLETVGHSPGVHEVKDRLSVDPRY
jgi:osmotically-inducible protein OsmY